MRVTREPTGAIPACARCVQGGTRTTHVADEPRGARVVGFVQLVIVGDLARCIRDGDVELRPGAVHLRRRDERLQVVLLQTADATLGPGAGAIIKSASHTRPAIYAHVLF